MLSNSNGVYIGSGWTWSGSGLKVKSNPTVATPSLVYRTNNQYTYSPDYTYIWTISVTGSFGSPEFNSLDFYEPWNNTNNPSFKYKISQLGFLVVANKSTNEPGDLIYMSSTLPFSTGNVELNSNFTSNIRLKISSTSSFGNGIHPDARFLKFNVKKTDWLIEGWAWRDDDTNEGWKWNSINNSLRFDYRKSQHVIIPPDIQTYHYSKADLLRINFCSKFVNFEKFNFSVNFEIQGDTSSYIKAYLIDNIKNVNPIATTSLLASGDFESLFNTDYQYLGKLSETGTYSFYNLTGNQYLAFFAWYPTASTYGTYSLELSNLKIDGGYSKTDNNEFFLLTNSETYDISTNLSLIGGNTISSYNIITTTPTTLHNNNNFIFGLTGGTGTYSGFFSDLYGTVSNLASLNSKLGNSKFKSGVWENGVWNSGQRIDDSIKYFNQIETSIKMNSNSTVWRVQLLGNTHSVSGLNIGDEVSVSNISIININEERVKLNNRWKIINLNEKRVIIETESVFPVMRIEKDSDNHKILLTKNIWKNGLFFNGIFNGVWNNGLVSGYPYLTKFEKTHWLNGSFNGGHFKSDKEEYNFIDTYYWEGFVGLTFGATAHGFNEGDIIEVDKDNKDINSYYDGLKKVTKVVDDYLIIVDAPWGENTTGESGKIKSQSTSLIQNLQFDSLNVSKKTSKDTQNLSEIWKYNSWMDLNWNSESSTNINTDRTYFNNNPSNFNEIFINNKFGLGEYAPLNLWGLTTDDVLYSQSKFRNINNTLIKNYELGTKYKIYDDYIDDSSNFDNTFGVSSEYGGLSNFISDGWTFSYYSFTAFNGLPDTSPNIYRTIDGTFKYEGSSNDIGLFLLNNEKINISKSRYSVIDMDYISGPENILSYSASGEVQNYDFHYIDLFNFPTFNTVDSNSVAWSDIDAFPQQLDGLYDNFLIYSKGINYKKGKIKEFFYNRTSLNLGLFSAGIITNSDNSFLGPGIASQSYHFELDNIKFYQVDMIPFFNYTNEDYINKDIQVPYSGISPFFDFKDDKVNFLENISFSLQGTILNKSNSVITIPQLPNDGESDLIFK